jgi:hypothetical protein
LAESKTHSCALMLYSTVITATHKMLLLHISLSPFYTQTHICSAARYYVSSAQITIYKIYTYYIT